MLKRLYCRLFGHSYTTRPSEDGGLTWHCLRCKRENVRSAAQMEAYYEEMRQWVRKELDLT